VTVMAPAPTDAQTRPHPHDRRAVWVAVVLLLVQVGLLARGAVLHAPTWDEVGHLSAGISGSEASS
jgi:hypothetical protein